MFPRCEKHTLCRTWLLWAIPGTTFNARMCVDIRNLESSQRTAERKELCPSPSNCGTGHNPPTPSYQSASQRGQSHRDVGLRKSTPRQVCRAGLPRYSVHPSQAQGPGKALESINGSLVPQFPVVFNNEKPQQKPERTGCFSLSPLLLLFSSLIFFLPASFFLSVLLQLTERGLPM